MAKKPLGTDSMGIQKTMRIGDYLADCGGQFALNAMTGLVSAVLYFYTEKHRMENGEKWDTERPISQKQYEKYLLERDTALSPVRKTKYRFVFADRRCEIDVYPFSAERAVLFQYGQSSAAPPTIRPECVLVFNRHAPLFAFRNIYMRCF